MTFRTDTAVIFAMVIVVALGTALVPPRALSQNSAPPATRVGLCATWSLYEGECFSGRFCKNGIAYEGACPTQNNRSVAPDPCALPAASLPVLTAADTNGNGFIDSAEIMRVVGSWISGQLSDADFNTIRDANASNCPIPRTTNQNQRAGGGLAPLEPGLGAPQDILGLGVLEDLNHDDRFTDADCDMLAKYLVRKIAVTDTRFDFNRDGIIGFPDVKACREMVATGLAGVTSGASGAIVPFAFPVSVDVRDSFGKTVEVSVATPSSPPNQHCTFDWGDGSRFPVNVNRGSALLSHSYSQSGSYTTAFRCASGNAVGEATKWIPVDTGNAAVSPSRYHIVVVGVPDLATARRIITPFVTQYSPLRELPNPFAPIEVHALQPNFSCADYVACPLLLEMAVNSSPYRNTVDLTIAITDRVGISTRGSVPNRPEILGFGSNSVMPEVVFTTSTNFYSLYPASESYGAYLSHEIGHALGFGHVDCGNPSPPVCTGANAADCQASDKSQDIMSYCQLVHFGPAAYAYMKNLFAHYGP